MPRSNPGKKQQVVDHLLHAPRAFHRKLDKLLGILIYGVAVAALQKLQIIREFCAARRLQIVGGQKVELIQIDVRSQLVVGVGEFVGYLVPVCDVGHKSKRHHSV